MLNRSLFLVVAFVASLTQANVAFAELKVGVYDNRQILANLPSVEKEKKKLDAEFEPKKKEISDLQNKLLALKSDIEKNIFLLLLQNDHQVLQLL